jgi:Family of unknown function (DUF5989)
MPEDTSIQTVPVKVYRASDLVMMAAPMMRLTPVAPRRRVPLVARTGIVSLLGELWDFMRVRKKWWLGPIVIVLALFGALIVFSQSSAIAPFVYTLF